MKIAIFFLLVGLCCCNDFSGSCSGSISACQAEVLVSLAVKMIWKYEASKGEAINMIDKVCLVDTACIMMDLICGYTNCKRIPLIDDLMACLKVPINVKLAVREALVTRNPLLVQDVDAPQEAIIKGVYCFLEKLMGKLAFANALNVVISSLYLVLGPLLTSLTNTIGGIVGLRFLPIDGVVDSLHFTITTLTGTVLSTVGNIVGGVVGGVLGGLVKPLG